MRTVFVIGAGANVEIGMPSGRELKEKIAENFNFRSANEALPQKTYNVFFAMDGIFRDQGQVRNIASTIREAMPFAISIDNFLDAHRLEHGIADAGKIAIVASILSAEKQSYLFNLDKKHDALSKTWYPLFFQKITEGCNIDELESRLVDISFIVFNYDRCFEYYMIHALDAYYKIGENRAFGIMKHMKIIHPYGVIGDLVKIPLGIEINHAQLMNLRQNIRTFTEDSEDTKKERTEIKHLIDRANRIVFLGFAYHQMNLDMLFKYSGYPATASDEAPLTDHFDCYGTGYDISEGDRKYIQDILKKLDARINNCDISDDTCAKFIKNFWYRLRFLE